MVVNWVAKNADFGPKEGKGFGKRAAHPHSTFLEVPPPPGQLPGAEGKPLPRERRSLDLARFSHFNIDNEKATH